MSIAKFEHVNVTVSDPKKTASMLTRLFGWKVRFIVKCLQIKKLSKKTNRSVDPVFVNNTSFNDLLY